MSHELRTPLNMIIGFSEMISQIPDAYGDALPAALLADVEVILRNSASPRPIGVGAGAVLVDADGGVQDTWRPVRFPAPAVAQPLVGARL